MDIDCFKDFNDTAGHLAGDDCLRKIAHTLQTSVHRAGDLIARYGGEEFVCVLPETDAAGAYAVAEKIQSLIAALALPHPRSSAGPFITLSLGVATHIVSPGESPESLLKAADLAMYRAKDAGRNRVVTWNEGFGALARTTSK
jgi:diguanylate cyclase (GGDEF)-like protein